MDAMDGQKGRVGTTRCLCGRKISLTIEESGEHDPQPAASIEDRLKKLQPKSQEHYEQVLQRWKKSRAPHRRQNPDAPEPQPEPTEQ